MEKRKCLAFLFCVILCYPLFQIIASAQSSLQVSIISQGSITYSPNTNLAVIPDDWGLTYGTGPQIIFLDTSVEHTAGNPSMRLAPHTSADMDTCREIDGTWYNVKPGDHIIVKVWVKTGPSGLNPDPSSTPGGRIGMDSYAHTSAGYGTPCTGTTKDTALGLPGWYGDQPASWNDGSIGATPNWWVSWGKDWTMIGWDVIVPSTVCSHVLRSDVVYACNPVQIDSFVFWLDARSINNPAFVWFADAELYINPQ